MGLPMVDLMWRDLTFCQFFLRSETRKLMPMNDDVRIYKPPTKKDETY